MLQQIGDEFELNSTLTNVSQAQDLTVAELIDRLDNRKDAQTIFLRAKHKWADQQRGADI
jgi:predicted DNA-binding ribbon-helix-helix protein